MKQGTRALVYAVGYGRVSTEEQAKAGVSLGMQEVKIRQYAELHTLDLVGIEHDDGVSAKNLKRPGVRRALARLDSGECNALVVYKLDRLTRSLKDWTFLIERYFGPAARFELMSVSDSVDTRTASGRLVLNIMMTVAQWELETVSERTQGTADHSRAEGRRISGPIPYGSRLVDDGRRSKMGNPVGIVADPAELAELERMLVMHRGGMSCPEIAADLNKRSVPTRGGGPWRRSTVRRLVS